MMPGPEDEDRDERGRWTSGAGDVSVATTKGEAAKQPEVVAAVMAWRGNPDNWDKLGPNGAPGGTPQGFVPQLAAAYEDPTSGSPAAQFLTAVASAPAGAPEMWRGMSNVPAGQVPKVGDQFSIQASSFSTMRTIAANFAYMGVSLPDHTSVTLHVEQGSQALGLKPYVQAGGGKDTEREYVALGKYEVVSEVPIKQGGNYGGTSNAYLNVRQIG